MRQQQLEQALRAIKVRLDRALADVVKAHAPVEPASLIQALDDIDEIVDAVLADTPTKEQPNDR